MGSIREFHDFKGEDIVLLSLDRDELQALRRELDVFLGNDQSPIMLGDCRLLLRKHRHTSGVNISAAGAELCMTKGAIDQLAGLLDGLLSADRPGHQYMDIDWPVPTLMISVAEYPEGFAEG